MLTKERTALIKRPEVVLIEERKESEKMVLESILEESERAEVEF